MKASRLSVVLAATSSRHLLLSSAFAQPANIQRHNRLESALMSSPANSKMDTGYLNAKDAAALDAELMSTPGFSLEQLMELAGMSVAEALYDVLSGDRKEGQEDRRKKHVLLVCGPGNNGGDGLVAARHLVHFGFDATIVYPKRSSKQHFINLVKQCEDLDIPILDEVPLESENQRFDSVVDAIFGFSFRSGGIREPFATAIGNLVELQKKQESVLVSVDVPSGWDVDGGDLTGANFHPDVLISLTAPKLSARKFLGRHYIGGRFLPPAIAQKYNIKMPPYSGCKQSIEVKNTNQDRELGSGEDDWAQAYQDYLNEKESGDMAKEKDSGTDASSVDEEEDWAAAYQAYCEEKEKEFFEKHEKS